MRTSHTRQHVESTENRSRDSRARDSTLSPSEAVSQHAKSTIVTPPPRVDLIICGKEDVVNTYMYWKIAHHKESLTTKKKREKKVQSWENLNVKFLIRYKLVFFFCVKSNYVNDVWFIPAVATTVKSSPQAACAIRLPTISPPMTQGPVRDLKSPTPS